MRYVALVICIFLFSFSAHSMSANNMVKGKLTGSDGGPLIGVTVLIKGTTTGVITDIDGNYSIECPTGSVLQFSYIGYKKQEITVSSEVINVVMEEDKIGLEEVVVVGIGYGTARKTDLTGSISTVSSDKFTKGVISSTEELIQGKVAGLTVMKNGGGDPSQGFSVRLRGGTSLSASNGPLYVVDGIPGVDINTISPSDIQSIDVLKDASAAAIYGSRGANGVILITTKKGAANKTLTEYNGYVAVGYASKYYDELSANQWRQYVRDNKVVGAVDYGANTNWQKEVEQIAISHNHNFSFQSGTDKTSYRASINYLDNQGIMLKSDLSRLGGSIYLSHSALKDRLVVDANMSSTYDQWQPFDTYIFRSLYNMNPTIPVKDKNGKYTEVEGIDYFNPVAHIMNQIQNDTRLRLLGYTKVSLEILKGLKAVVDLSATINTHEGRYYVLSTDKLAGANQGYGRKTIDDNYMKQIETYLTYEFKKRDHTLNLLGGYSYMNNMYEGSGAERRKFDTDLFLYNNLGAGFDARPGDVYSYKGEATLISVFGRVNYNYKGRYLATATIRQDGSSKFGKNKKYGLFPSANFAWRISDEPFMASTGSWLNNLKLRVGYGVTGNQEGIQSYSSIQLLGQTSGTGNMYYDPASKTWKKAYGVIQNTNPDLQWEQTAQTDIGIDFILLNRINGTFDYYNKKTSKLLFTYNVGVQKYPFSYMLANVGDLSNKGIELTLSAVIIDKPDLKWNIDVNFASNSQKILKLSNKIYTTDVVYEGDLTNAAGLSNVYAQVIKEGYVAGTFYGYHCDSITKDGKYALHDYNNDGKITPDKDKVVLGDVQPDFSTGFGTNVMFKGIDLNISFNGVFGQKLLNTTYMSIMVDKRLPTYNVPDKALTDKVNADPLFSDYWIENGSFLRLQQITLGYSIPFKANGWVKKVRIYVTGENLHVWTKYSGLDPELNLEGLTSPGIEFYNFYPRPRTFSFGLNVSF